jgi:hypothetical protein
MSTCTTKDELLRCSKCGEMKPADCFYRDRSRTRGRCCECKACSSDRIKKHREAREKEYDMITDALLKAGYEKVCKRCKRLLPCGMFSRGLRNLDYLRTYCRECDSKCKTKRQYGLTDEVLDKMLSVETCQMPGCGKKLEERCSTHIDHCHTSGKVRAVLCRRCNTMLGYVQKTPHLLQPMLNYIAKHKADNEAA